jgi:hypothetical protein
MIEIERVDNGYTCQWWENNEEGEELVKHQQVFEEINKEHGEIECFQQLLWFITEHFGMVGSKHDTRRISIAIGDEDADGICS